MLCFRVILVAVASVVLTLASKAQTQKRSYDLGTYEYDSWEESDSKEAGAAGDPEDYKWIQNQLSGDIDAKDWESVWKKVLGPEEFQEHYTWLQKLHELHSKRMKVKQVGEAEARSEKPTELSEELEAEALISANGVGNQENADAWTTAEESDEGGVRDLGLASQIKAEQSGVTSGEAESEEDIFTAGIIEETVKKAPEIADDYIYSWSDESEESPIAAAPLEKGKDIEGEEVVNIVPEFNMKDDMMSVSEDGGSEEEEDSEIIVESIPGKTMADIIKSVEEQEEEDAWMSPRIVIYAQTHKSMMLAVTIMFFMLSILMLGVTLYRTYRLCQEFPSAAPGAYHRMDEDTDSLCSIQKV